MKFIDASGANPAIPFTDAYQYAYEKTQPFLHLYDDDLRRTAESASLIKEFFEIGFGLKKQNLPPLDLLFTNGITEGLHLTIGMLERAYRCHSGSSSNSIQPAVLMPAPYYRFFRNHPIEHHFKIISIEREPDGSVSPQKLDETITQTHARGDHVILAYIDSTPTNLNGHIRTWEETRAQVDVFKKHNLQAARRDAQMRARHPELPPNFSTQILLIDDFVYLGTEFEPKLPTPFLSFPEMFETSLLLAGGTKIGLASLRTGVLLGSKENIIFKTSLYLNSYFPSSLTVHALEAVFPTTRKLQEARMEHLERMNSHHRFSGKMIKALIDGEHSVTISQADKETMVRVISRTQKIDENQAREKLHNGIFGIQAHDFPEAGFFLTANFSDFRNHYYAQPQSNADVTKLKKDYDLVSFFERAEKIKMGYGSYMGMDPDKFLTRLTFSISPGDIARLTKRLERGIALLGKTPTEARRAFIQQKGEDAYSAEPVVVSIRSH